MPSADAQPVTVDVDPTQSVSGLMMAPAGARACYVVGHGAGLGMTHPFMVAVAEGLAERGIATLRYQFPFMEQGGKRPDPPKLGQATVRAAVAEASRLAPGLTLFAGGKSYGGRMTSQAQAAEPMPGVRGLAFLGFPLHAPRQPSDERAGHLSAIKIPMLFFQGTRDDLADVGLLKPLVERLGPASTLKLFDGGDHSFRVPKSSGRTNAEVMAELLDSLPKWIDGLT